MRDLGVHVVCADMLDLAAVRDAFSEVKRAYFTCGVVPNYTEIATNVAVAAREASVEVLINMSQITSEAGASSPQTRQHWLSERLFDWAAVNPVHLRCSLFAEDLIMVAMRSVSRDNTLSLPWGSGRVSPIAGWDIARSVVAILAQPLAHVGQTYHLTGGDDPLTPEQIADELSRALGRMITYRDLPRDVWAAQMQKAGVLEHLVEHLSRVADKMKENRYARKTHLVEQLTGQPAMNVFEFAQRYRDRFSAGGEAPVPASSSTRRAVGS